MSHLSLDEKMDDYGYDKAYKKGETDISSGCASKAAQSHSTSSPKTNKHTKKETHTPTLFNHNENIDKDSSSSGNKNQMPSEHPNVNGKIDSSINNTSNSIKLDSNRNPFNVVSSMPFKHSYQASKITPQIHTTLIRDHTGKFLKTETAHIKPWQNTLYTTLRRSPLSPASTTRSHLSEDNATWPDDVPSWYPSDSHALHKLYHMKGDIISGYTKLHQPQYTYRDNMNRLYKRDLKRIGRLSQCIINSYNITIPDNNNNDHHNIDNTNKPESSSTDTFNHDDSSIHILNNIWNSNDYRYNIFLLESELQRLLRFYTQSDLVPIYTPLDNNIAKYDHNTMVWTNLVDLYRDITTQCLTNTININQNNDNNADKSHYREKPTVLAIPPSKSLLYPLKNKHKRYSNIYTPNWRLYDDYVAHDKHFYSNKRQRSGGPSCLPYIDYNALYTLYTQKYLNYMLYYRLVDIGTPAPHDIQPSSDNNNNNINTPRSVWAPAYSLLLLNANQSLQIHNANVVFNQYIAYKQPYNNYTDNMVTSAGNTYNDGPTIFNNIMNIISSNPYDIRLNHERFYDDLIYTRQCILKNKCDIYSGDTDLSMDSDESSNNNQNDDDDDTTPPLSHYHNPKRPQGYIEASFDDRMSRNEVYYRHKFPFYYESTLYDPNDKRYKNKNISYDLEDMYGIKSTTHNASSLPQQAQSRTQNKSNIIRKRKRDNSTSSPIDLLTFPILRVSHDVPWSTQLIDEHTRVSNLQIPQNKSRRSISTATNTEDGINDDSTATNDVPMTNIDLIKHISMYTMPTKTEIEFFKGCPPEQYVSRLKSLNDNDDQCDDFCPVSDVNRSLNCTNHHDPLIRSTTRRFILQNNPADIRLRPGFFKHVIQTCKSNLKTLHNKKHLANMESSSLLSSLAEFKLKNRQFIQQPEGGYNIDTVAIDDRNGYKKSPITPAMLTKTQVQLNHVEKPHELSLLDRLCLLGESNYHYRPSDDCKGIIYNKDIDPSLKLHSLNTELNSAKIPTLYKLYTLLEKIHPKQTIFGKIFNNKQLSQTNLIQSEDGSTTTLKPYPSLIKQLGTSNPDKVLNMLTGGLVNKKALMQAIKDPKYGSHITCDDDDTIDRLVHRYMNPVGAQIVHQCFQHNNKQLRQPKQQQQRASPFVSLNAGNQDYITDRENKGRSMQTPKADSKKRDPVHAALYYAETMPIETAAAAAAASTASSAPTSVPSATRVVNTNDKDIIRNAESQQDDKGPTPEFESPSRMSQPPSSHDVSLSDISGAIPVSYSLESPDTTSIGAFSDQLTPGPTFGVSKWDQNQGYPNASASLSTGLNSGTKGLNTTLSPVIEGQKPSSHLGPTDTNRPLSARQHPRGQNDITGALDDTKSDIIFGSGDNMHTTPPLKPTDLKNDHFQQALNNKMAAPSRQHLDSSNFAAPSQFQDTNQDVQPSHQSKQQLNQNADRKPVRSSNLSISSDSDKDIIQPAPDSNGKKESLLGPSQKTPLEQQSSATTTPAKEQSIESFLSDTREYQRDKDSKKLAPKSQIGYSTTDKANINDNHRSDDDGEHDKVHSKSNKPVKDVSDSTSVLAPFLSNQKSKQHDENKTHDDKSVKPSGKLKELDKMHDVKGDKKDIEQEPDHDKYQNTKGPDTVDDKKYDIKKSKVNKKQNTNQTSPNSKQGHDEKQDMKQNKTDIIRDKDKKQDIQNNLQSDSKQQYDHDKNQDKHAPTDLHKPQDQSGSDKDTKTVDSNKAVVDKESKSSDSKKESKPSDSKAPDSDKSHHFGKDTTHDDLKKQHDDKESQHQNDSKKNIDKKNISSNNKDKKDNKEDANDGGDHKPSAGPKKDPKTSKNDAKTRKDETTASSFEKNCNLDQSKTDHAAPATKSSKSSNQKGNHAADKLPMDDHSADRQLKDDHIVDKLPNDDHIANNLPSNNKRDDHITDKRLKDDKYQNKKGETKDDHDISKIALPSPTVQPVILPAQLTDKEKELFNGNQKDYNQKQQNGMNRNEENYDVQSQQLPPHSHNPRASPSPLDFGSDSKQHEFQYDTMDFSDRNNLNNINNEDDMPSYPHQPLVRPTSAILSSDVSDDDYDVFSPLPSLGGRSGFDDPTLRQNNKSSKGIEFINSPISPIKEHPFSYPDDKKNKPHDLSDNEPTNKANQRPQTSVPSYVAPLTKMKDSKQDDTRKDTVSQPATTKSKAPNLEQSDAQGTKKGLNKKDDSKLSKQNDKKSNGKDQIKQPNISSSKPNDKTRDPPTPSDLFSKPRLQTPSSQKRHRLEFQSDEHGRIISPQRRAEETDKILQSKHDSPFKPTPGLSRSARRSAKQRANQLKQDDSIKPKNDVKNDAKKENQSQSIAVDKGKSTIKGDNRKDVNKDNKITQANKGTQAVPQKSSNNNTSNTTTNTNKGNDNTKGNQNSKNPSQTSKQSQFQNNQGGDDDGKRRPTDKLTTSDKSAEGKIQDKNNKDKYTDNTIDEKSDDNKVQSTKPSISRPTSNRPTSSSSIAPIHAQTALKPAVPGEAFVVTQPYDFETEKHVHGPNHIEPDGRSLLNSPRPISFFDMKKQHLSPSFNKFFGESGDLPPSAIQNNNIKKNPETATRVSTFDPNRAIGQPIVPTLKEEILAVLPRLHHVPTDQRGSSSPRLTDMQTNQRFDTGQIDAGDLGDISSSTTPLPYNNNNNNKAYVPSDDEQLTFDSEANPTQHSSKLSRKKNNIIGSNIDHTPDTRDHLHRRRTSDDAPTQIALEPIIVDDLDPSRMPSVQNYLPTPANSEDPTLAGTKRLPDDTDTIHETPWVGKMGTRRDLTDEKSSKQMYAEDSKDFSTQ